MEKDTKQNKFVKLIESLK
jgi:hypothetical protein